MRLPSRLVIHWLAVVLIGSAVPACDQADKKQSKKNPTVKDADDASDDEVSKDNMARGGDETDDEDVDIIDGNGDFNEDIYKSIVAGLDDYSSGPIDIEALTTTFNGYEGGENLTAETVKAAVDKLPGGNADFDVAKMAELIKALGIDMSKPVGNPSPDRGDEKYEPLSSQDA